MSIQISGTTVIDNSRNLTNGGSGSFSSTVTVATPTSSNHATTKTYVDNAFAGVAGKILQVQQTFTDNQSYSSSSLNWVQMAALNRTITTTQTNSKILLVGMVAVGTDAGAVGEAILAFTRGGSRIGTGSNSGSSPGSGGGLYTMISFYLDNWSSTYLDSPSVSSGTTLTYGVQFAIAYPSNAIAYINRTGDGANQLYDPNGSSTLVAIEIAP